MRILASILLILPCISCGNDLNAKMPIDFARGCWVDNYGTDGRIDSVFNFLPESENNSKLKGTIVEIVDGNKDPYISFEIHQGNNLTLTRVDSGVSGKLIRVDPPQSSIDKNVQNYFIAAFRAEEDGEWILFKGDKKSLIIYLVHADQSTGMTFFMGRSAECS